MIDDILQNNVEQKDEEGKPIAILQNIEYVRLTIFILSSFNYVKSF